MHSAWKVIVVRPDGAELRVMVVADGMTDASDAAIDALRRFGVDVKGLVFGAVERLY